MRAPLITALLVLSASASAGGSKPQPIKLENQKATGQSVTGTCGPAVVKVTGLEAGDAMASSGFSGLTATISIQSGNSTLMISPDPDSGSNIFLQDRNKLQCVITPSGPKLILAMYCYGRSCAPVDYRVIDAKTAMVISKQDKMDECDAVCARKALGAPVPSELLEGG
jgi:hypothetical protein